MSFDAVESICVIPATGYDEMWMVVNREGGRYIERMTLRLASVAIGGEQVVRPEDSIFLDSTVTYNAGSATEFAGLTHLANEVVGILADGVVQDQQTVPASGTITLSSAATIVNIGLPYASDLETLNINRDTQLGTLQGLRVKVANVTFMLQDTRGGYIGPDENNLFEAFTQDKINKSSGQNISATELFTGKVRDSLGSQFEGNGTVFIRQVDPLPITIGAIIPEVSVGGQSR